MVAAGWGAGLLALRQQEEAIELVRSKRQPAGSRLLGNTHAGQVHLELETGDGRPSRWNTFRALRVLNWYGAGG